MRFKTPRQYVIDATQLITIFNITNQVDDHFSNNSTPIRNYSKDHQASARVDEFRGGKKDSQLISPN